MAIGQRSCQFANKNDNHFTKIQLSALLCPAARKHSRESIQVGNPLVLRTPVEPCARRPAPAAVKTTDTAKFSTMDRHQQGTPDFYCRLNAAPESNFLLIGTACLSPGLLAFCTPAVLL